MNKIQGPAIFLAQFAGEKIHRAAEIPIRAFDRVAIEAVAARLERRASIGLSVSGGEVYLSMADQTFVLPMVEHRIEGR